MTAVQSANDLVRTQVEQFRESQYWDLARLRRYQENLLERLVVHAYEEVPFYAERLKPLFRRRFGPHLHKWDRVPVLTRAEVQANQDALRARSLPGSHGRTRTYTTSGSTGRPVRIVRSALSKFVTDIVMYRRLQGLGLDFDAPLARITRLPKDHDGDVLREVGWNQVFAMMGHRGRRIDINGALEPDACEALLRAERPTYLFAFATRLSRVAAASAGGPVPSLPIRLALSSGERLSPDHCATVRAAWGAPVVDNYAGLDVGSIAGQCGEGSPYHMQMETMVSEIVDDAGRAVPAGTSGRVLVTPLYHHAMPLIRYEIGDFATAGTEPCPCGRTLATLTSIEGRARDLIRFPDGATAWPAMDFASILDPARIRCHQIVYDGAWGVEVRYAADSELGAKEREAAEAALRARLHERIEVAFSFQPDLADVTGGKSRPFLRVAET